MRHGAGCEEGDEGIGAGVEEGVWEGVRELLKGAERAEHGGAVVERGVDDLRLWRGMTCCGVSSERADLRCAGGGPASGMTRSLNDA